MGWAINMGKIFLVSRGVKLFLIVVLFHSMSLANEPALEKIAMEEYSFCTSAETYHVVGLISDNWAFIVHFSNNQLEKESGRIEPRSMIYHEGPNINKYIGRSAGPRRPDVPSNDNYSKIVVNTANITYTKSNGGLLVRVEDALIKDRSYSFKNAVPFYCQMPRP